MMTGKTPIDIEDLVRWAIGQTGYLPWRGISERELMYDHGYTVVPRGCSRAFSGGATVLSRAIDDDAAIVVETVKALPGGVAAVVIACGRKGVRPDWMPGIEPRLVPITKRHKKKHRRVVTGHRWVPCDPTAICAAREIYRRWHAALLTLASDLDGRLSSYQINGLAAAKMPWEVATEKAA